MKRVFAIEWPDELGLMWLNQDNLMFCLLSVCKDTSFTVTDVTNKPEQSMVEGADPCFLKPSVHDPDAIKEWLAEWERSELFAADVPSSPVEDLAEGYRTALKERDPREFRRLIEGSWEEDTVGIPPDTPKEMLHIEQPPPKPGRTPVGPTARYLFEGVLRLQEEKGLKKYGTRLETFNGRNPLLDAMAEVVDAFQYLTQSYLEQTGSFPSTEELKEAFGQDE